MAVRDLRDLAGAFQSANGAKVEALMVQAQPFTNLRRTQKWDLVARHKLPAMYTLSSFAVSGGLTSYGPSLSDHFRRAASYVDKIIRGAKPAGLSVEQPAKFELVVNLKTANALQLALQRSI